MKFMLFVAPVLSLLLLTSASHADMFGPACVKSATRKCPVDPSVVFESGFTTSANNDGSVITISGLATLSKNEDGSNPSTVPTHTTVAFKPSSSDLSGPCYGFARDAKNARQAFRIIGYVPADEEGTANYNFLTVAGCVVNP